MAMIAISAGASLAHAELINIGWNASGHYEKTATVQPGKFLELCGGLTKGQAVGWRFESDQALDFNVHFHEGKAVVFPAKHEAARQASGTLNVAVAQDYCWMWSNTTPTTATLTARLKR